MSIKIRLRLSYITMLIVPFLFIVLIMKGFTSYIEGNVGFMEKIGVETVVLPKQIIVASNIFSRKVNIQMQQNKEAFLKSAYLDELQKNIGLSYGGVILRKDKEIIYSSDCIKKEIVNVSLPEFGSEAVEQRCGDFYKNNLMLLQQQDLYFQDNSKGSIFYIVNLAYFKKVSKEIITLSVIVILFILIATNAVLTYLVSRSITKPLKELENATNEIKDGNLEYKTKIYRRDEVGKVGAAFEEMRFRLKESLELQQQYEKNRNELISNISHDLKTPITSIKGYVEGIKDGVADTPEKIERYINTIHAKAAYMDTLIDDLFLFSKLDLNKIPFDFKIIDLTIYMRECVEELRLELNKADVEIILTVLDGSIFVKGDVQKLKRVILNIIGNCIKYKDNEKLKIQIEIKEEEDTAVVKIRDNGQGISQEALPFIFDRFYRGDAARDASSGGSGLGLAIVKKIIEEHGGQIFAESKEKEGTVITFTLKTHRRGAQR